MSTFGCQLTLGLGAHRMYGPVPESQLCWSNSEVEGGVGLAPVAWIVRWSELVPGCAIKGTPYRRGEERVGLDAIACLVR